MNHVRKLDTTKLAKHLITKIEEDPRSLTKIAKSMKLARSTIRLAMSGTKISEETLEKLCGWLKVDCEQFIQPGTPKKD